MLGALAMAVLGGWVVIAATAQLRAKEIQGFSGCVDIVFLGACLVGIGLGAASYDRRFRNPPIVWIAIVLNGILLGLDLILMIVNIFGRAA